MRYVVICLLFLSPSTNADLVWNSCEGDNFTWRDTTIPPYSSHVCAADESVTLDGLVVEKPVDLFLVRASTIIVRETHFKGEYVVLIGE